MSVPARIFIAITILVALAVAMMIMPTEQGSASKRAGGYIGVLVVLVGIPALIAYLVAGWKKVRHPNRFALVFCVIAGILSLGNAATMLSFETPQQRFTRLMREAAGVQPVSHKGFPSQRRLDDAVRSQYGKMLQQNRDYMEQVSKLDNSKVKEINTAKAFTSDEIAQPALDQLHALYDADAAHEREVQNTLNDLRHVFEDVQPAAEREAMLKGFDESLTQQNVHRRQLLDLEKTWIDSVDDEHAYAAAHRDSFRLVGPSLIIADPAVRTEFNEKIQLQEANRKAFLKLQAEFSKSTSESLGKMGLSGKDVGRK